jgi:hypothetical protein
LPPKQVHLNKAADNESLATSLNPLTPSAPNWAITMTFYAALHYVEAYFFTQGADYRLHPHRDSAIQRDPKIRGIWRPYERLKDASEHARYESIFFTDAQFQHYRPNLESIKNVITPLL